LDAPFGHVFGPMSFVGVGAQMSDVYVRKWIRNWLSLASTGNFQLLRERLEKWLALS